MSATHAYSILLIYTIYGVQVDVSGVVYGMASLAGIVESTGHIPGSIYAFLGCGVATLVGASLGLFLV